MALADWIPGAGPFVGRQAELDLLKSLWSDARGGTGKFVLLGGPAGIGKSRLVREFIASVSAEGGVVATAAAFESEGEGFRPFRELGRSLARSLTGAERTKLNDAMDALAHTSGTDQAPTERQARFDAVVDALDAAAGQTGGCLLAFDDVHWADDSTLRLLTHLARRVGQTRMMVIATHRPAGTTLDEGLRALSSEVRRLPSGVRLTLPPLTDVESSQFIAAITGNDSGNIMRALIQRSDGNPLFLEELVRESLMSPKGVVHVPVAIADLVQDRLARLDGSARRTGVAAAVLGEHARLDRLMSLVEMDRQETSRAVDALVAAGILGPPDDALVTFRHALIREAVYASLGLEQRTELHLRAAALLGAGAGTETNAAAVAFHLRAAGTRESLGRAAELYVVAAARSLDVLAYEDAAQQLTTAISLMDQVDEDVSSRQRAQLLLAEAHRRAEKIDDALRRFHETAIAAGLSGNVEIEAQAALGYERTYVVTGRPRSDPDALSISLLSDALAHLGDTPDTASLRARLLAALSQACFFNHELERAERNSRDALTVARASKDSAAEAAALETLRIVSWRPDHPDKRLEIAREIVRLATSVGDRDQLLDGMYWEISCLMEMGFVDSAARNINRYQRIAHEMHSAKRRADGALMRAMLAHLRGDCRSALELASQAVQLGREAGYADAEIHYAAQLAEFADESDLADTVRDLIRDHELWLRSPSRRALLAFLQCRLGYDAEAERLIGDLASDDFRSVPRDWMWLPLMKMLCESIARLGRADWAAVVYGLLLPYADQFIVNSNSVYYGSVELWLGVAAATAGMPEAIQHLQRAVECNEGAGAPVWGARSREELGRLLLDSGEAEKGRVFASAAARDYQEFGLARSAERAAALLSTAASVASRPTIPSGLTGREVEVLRLIAGGRSNKEIADQLFLSVRTVERHITNLYAKIDAHGKADAAAFAIRHHLID